jgi:phosphatidylglycerophosphate synthase
MTRFPLQLPRAPLRSSVIRIVVWCLAVILVLAPVVASWTMSGADYIRRCLLFFVAAAIVVIGRVGPHHPFPRFGAANSVTLLRVALAAGVAGLIGEAPGDRIALLAVATVVVVAALDGVDGWLARRDGQASSFGARFDMETDAAFILILSALVWQHGKAGVWVLGCGLMRYLFVAAGWVLPWMAAPLRSTMRGKSAAVGQFVGLSVALLPLVKPPVSDVVAALTLALLVWSFAVDVAWLRRQT